MNRARIQSAADQLTYSVAVVVACLTGVCGIGIQLFAIPEQQTAVVLRPIEGDDTAHLQSAINRADTVNLLGDFDCASPVYLDSGTRLNTPAATPATIKRTGSSRQLLVMNGTSIRVNRVKLDWGTTADFPEFACLVDFRVNDWSGVEAKPLGDIQLVDVDFFNSGEPWRHNGKDRWCVSFTTHAAAVIEGVKLIRCRSLMPGVQLTGNGSGPGYRGLTIQRCEAYGGRNAGIALSSLNTESQTVFADVLIERCILRDCHGVGIFVGQDGESARDVFIEGLTIRNNFIEPAAEGPDYPIAILIRGGQVDGCTVDASLTGNVVDLRLVRPTRHPRSLVMLPGASGGKLSFVDNLVFGGDFEHQAVGVEVTRQSGNRKVAANGSSELKVAN